MNIEQKIDRILTEYNFDRMSFDEAKQELLNLHNVVGQSEQSLCEDCNRAKRYLKFRVCKTCLIKGKYVAK